MQHTTQSVSFVCSGKIYKDEKQPPPMHSFLLIFFKASPCADENMIFIIKASNIN